LYVVITKCIDTHIYYGILQDDAIENYRAQQQNGYISLFEISIKSVKESLCTAHARIQEKLLEVASSVIVSVGLSVIVSVGLSVIVSVGLSVIVCVVGVAVVVSVNVVVSVVAIFSVFVGVVVNVKERAVVRMLVHWTPNHWYHSLVFFPRSWLFQSKLGILAFFRGPWLFYLDFFYSKVSKFSANGDYCLQNESHKRLTFHV